MNKRFGKVKNSMNNFWQDPFFFFAKEVVVESWNSLMTELSVQIQDINISVGIMLQLR